MVAKTSPKVTTLFAMFTCVFQLVMSLSVIQLLIALCLEVAPLIGGEVSAKVKIDDKGRHGREKVLTIG